MNLRFLCLAVVVTSRSLGPSEKREFKLKLDKYQDATGIDDAKKEEIWNQTMKNSKISNLSLLVQYNFYFQSCIRNQKTQMKSLWLGLQPIEVIVERYHRLFLKLNFSILA